MEAFYQIYKTLLEENNPLHVRRGLQETMDFSGRLVGIRGARGVGKTTLLLDIASELCPCGGRECLYVNLNHLYFADRTIYEFGREFCAAGGRLLLLDQVYKYPTWAEEIATLLGEFENLTIVFTTSAATPELATIKPIAKMVREYQLSGFSLREYINSRTGQNLPVYQLSEVLQHHDEIAPEILEKVNAQEYFNTYLKGGYYPSRGDGQHYYEEVVKAINMTLEVDVVYLSQIDPTYLGKLRKLVYMLTTQGGQIPNISALSEEIGTSRATLMNYIHSIVQAGLLQLVHKQGQHDTKKMGRVYAQNSNLLQVMYPHIPSREMECTVFMLSQLTPHYKVETPTRKGVIDLIVEDDTNISIKERGKTKPKPDVYYAMDHINVGIGNEVPLWLFGFLY